MYIGHLSTFIKSTELLCNVKSATWTMNFCTHLYDCYDSYMLLLLVHILSFCYHIIARLIVSGRFSSTEKGLSKLSAIADLLAGWLLVL